MSSPNLIGPPLPPQQVANLQQGSGQGSSKVHHHGGHKGSPVSPKPDATSSNQPVTGNNQQLPVGVDTTV